MARIAVLALVFATFVSADDKPTTLDLWPGKPPGLIVADGNERDTTKPKDNLIAGKRLIRLGHVSKPTITVYKPAKDKDTGTCVIVCPGGAYNILALDLEGTEVCEWLNRQGITGVLLKYRVPAPKMGARHLPALMDAQRAVSLVRSRASEWNIDPKKIGILGFSAGGHLAAVTATGEDKRAYETIDTIDEVSSRPNFAVLIYPGYLTDAKREKLAPELQITKNTPPMLLVHAGDDPVPPESSALMYLALKKAGVPAELHIWAKGGHGYGLRKTDQPVTAWTERAEEWFKGRGLMNPPPK
jgi:acetyl esterase/lipase